MKKRAKHFCNRFRDYLMNEDPVVYKIGISIFLFWVFVFFVFMIVDPIKLLFWM